MPLSHRNTYTWSLGFPVSSLWNMCKSIWYIDMERLCISGHVALTLKRLRVCLPTPTIVESVGPRVNASVTRWTLSVNLDDLISHCIFLLLPCFLLSVVLRVTWSQKVCLGWSVDLVTPAMIGWTIAYDTRVVSWNSMEILITPNATRRWLPTTKTTSFRAGDLTALAWLCRSRILWWILNKIHILRLMR